MVSYFAYRCSLKPWIIKKLGNFQLENCYRDVTDPVMAQVIGAVRVPSEDGTGGTALVHDTQLRMTCNFTDSAIADFEKKELETSECEFSDLDDALVILERYRLVPTLFSVLNDCVFTVVVYSFRLKSFSKMGGDCSSTRMAHHHFRISKKLRELWGQWKNGDLAFITDESDSTGTVTDMTLSHTIRFMEDQMEAGSEDTPESCKSLSEPHKEDREQPHVMTGRSDKSNNSRENDERDGTEGSPKNTISLRQHQNDKDESTTAVFKVDMPTFKQMKCNEHEECILMIHHTSSQGDRTEDRPVDNDALVEVLDALPIMLYTSFPDDSNQDLPNGLYSWEVDAINEEDTRDGDGRDEPKGCQAASSSNSVVGPSESLSSECQGEGMVALKWPPSSPSVEESISANGASVQPAADGDVSGGVESSSGFSIQYTEQRLNVEAKTKETTSVDPDFSKSSSSDDTEGKNGNSFVEGTSGPLILDTSGPLVPVMSTTSHEEDLETAITEKSSFISGGNRQVENHSNIVIPESSDSSQESQPRTTTQSLSFESTATSTETEINQAEVIKGNEVGQLSAMTSKSSGMVGMVEASSSVSVASKQSTECVTVDDTSDGKNQEDSSLEKQTHLIKDKGENINYERPSNEKIASGNSTLFDKLVEISTEEKTLPLNERQREDFVHVGESEQPESNISVRDSHENAVTCEEYPPLDWPNISKATSPSIVKCKDETSSADGYDIYAEGRFEVPSLPKEEETHVSRVHSPTFPETQPFHVNSDEESYREYPETQMFEVEDSALPQGDQKEANSSEESVDADRPPGTQPFDVIECIASNATKDQEALVVSLADGAHTNIQGPQELNCCSIQDSPNDLNKAFLQTQESQDKLMQSQESQGKLIRSQESQDQLVGSQGPHDKLMRSQNRTINLSQGVEKASIKQIRPRTSTDASLSPKNEGQDRRPINSDSNESLEDIFLRPSENDEEPQIPDSVEHDVCNILHGALSHNAPLPCGDRSHLDDTVLPSGIKVQRKRKRNKVARNPERIENEDLDASQKQNKVRRKGSSLTMLGSKLPCGSIPSFVCDKSLAGVSPKTRHESLASPNKEEKKNRASICEKFVEKLKDLKCSCGESVSDDSHSSLCSPCWSHGTVNCQTSEKISRVQGGSKDSELKREIAAKTTKSVAFGGDKPTDNSEPASSSHLFEVKATPQPKSNRKHRRMTREEAATSKRKLTEARFLRWLERNYGLQERRKKGKQTFDLMI